MLVTEVISQFFLKFLFGDLQLLQYYVILICGAKDMGKFMCGNRLWTLKFFSLES